MNSLMTDRSGRHGRDGLSQNQNAGAVREDATLAPHLCVLQNHGFQFKA